MYFCTFINSSFCKSSLIFNIVISNNRTIRNVLLYRYLKYLGRYLLNNNCYISRKSLEMTIIKSRLEVKNPIYWQSISNSSRIILLLHINLNTHVRYCIFTKRGAQKLGVLDKNYFF